MYNWEQKGWFAECTDKERIDRYQQEAQEKENVKARFYWADFLLSKGNSGSNVSEAIWNMESAAKKGYPAAAFAMGQLFHSGWAVKKNEKIAKGWYEKAASLGYPGAEEAWQRLGRSHKRRLAVLLGGSIFAVVLLIAAGIVGYQMYRGEKNGQEKPKDQTIWEVKVRENTELTEPATAEEFNRQLQAVIDKYDDELVISGQRSSNRLLLNFKEGTLDLSDFPADKVIASEESMIVIQFATEEETKRCMETLRSTEGVIFVEEDTYTNMINEESDRKDDEAAAGNMFNYGYISDVSGYKYYTWGAMDMQLDQLAAWMRESVSGQAVVAVVDSGVKANAETKDRILEGIDLVDSFARAQTDYDGHGTHVSGTILDCTQGVDIKILPVRVLDQDGVGASSVISLGVYYAVEEGAQVINLSLGGPHSECKDEAIKKALEAGVVVVVAAGNEGAGIGDTKHCPAHIKEALTVGAYMQNHQIAEFSNYGDCVDVSAPGYEVVSYGLNDDLVALDGTSMATPHVSALAAMLRICYPDALPAQIQKYIKDYCDPLGDEAHYGKGICRGSAYVEFSQ